MGIFNQQGVCRKGQAVDKAIACLLIYRGIHDDRRGQAMWLAELPLLSDKRLEAHAQRGIGLVATAINHCVTLQHPAIVQRNRA